MKKQLFAATVAIAIAAPLLARADVSVYGHLHYSVDSINYGTLYNIAMPGSGMDVLPADYDGSAVNSHDSRFGIKGSEDLGEGLSLLFQMEFSIDGDDLGGVNNDRNTYVALGGNWGVVGIGQVDTPFKSSTASLELFPEQAGDQQQLYIDDIRAPDAVFYMSPDWNGFSFAAAVVIPSLDNDTDGIEATSISATYNNGPFFATLAYEDISDDMISALHSLPLGDYDKWRLGLGYTANGLHVGFVYEDRHLDDFHLLNPILEDDGHSWQLSGSYTMGNNVIKAAYGQIDDMGRRTGAVAFINDGELWSIGLDHKLSTRTKVYAAYTEFDTDTTGVEFDVLSLGIIHDF